MSRMLLIPLLVVVSGCAKEGVHSSRSAEAHDQEGDDVLVMQVVTPGLPPLPVPVDDTNQSERVSEELQRSVQEYQMEMVRRGLPALAIPLTPESEQQLIKEGYLSPEADAPAP